MPQSAAELVGVLSVSEEEADVYSGKQPDEPRLMRVFGGQVIAQALNAATRTVGEERAVHSLHAYFVLGGDPELPIRYEVTRVRDGGSFTTRRVAAIQHGREICHVMASFQIKENGMAHAVAPLSAGVPENLPTVPAILRERGGVDADFWEREWAALDMRVEAAPRREDGLPSQRIWFKVREDLGRHQQLHREALAYMSDLTLLSVSLVPHGHFIGDSQVQRASLDHSIWFHDDVNVNEWLLYDQVSPWAGSGRGLGRAEVFDCSGRLVASVVQEGLIRQRDRGRDNLIRPR